MATTAEQRTKPEQSAERSQRRRRSSRRPPRDGIGYVLKKFPTLSETFVLNEILAQEALGERVHIFSLERPNDSRFHQDLSRLQGSISYIPDFHGFKSLWKMNRNNLFSKDRRRYLKIFLSTLSKGHPTLMWRLLQACFVANQAKSRRLGHLHAHFSNSPATIACLAGEIANIPFSFTGHAVDLFLEKYAKPKVLSDKISRSRFAVTVSDFNKEMMDGLSRGNPDKIHRIYNGINLEKFNTNGDAPPETFTILTVARLIEKKGLPTLVEACEILRDQEVPFKCEIVGGGGLYSTLRQMIREKNLTDQVSLLGAMTQEQVVERYHSSNLFVLPCQVGANGNRDGLPVSIVEALACGLPVVSTPVTGIPEAINDGYNGLLVPESDPAALAGAIESLITDRQKYDRMRECARESVENQFDLRNSAKELNELFHWSIAQNGQG
ncbi:MAG: glycosyltransferase family 4 protein [Dehalococcoidia bacterium]